MREANINSPHFAIVRVAHEGTIDADVDTTLGIRQLQKQRPENRLTQWSGAQRRKRQSVEVRTELSVLSQLFQLQTKQF